MDTIKHEKHGRRDVFYYEDAGKRLAEMVYTMAEEDVMVIEHTEVDASLKGQGVGKKLLGALVEYVREHNIQVVPVCPFANATFQKTPEWQDVLADKNIRDKPDPS